ncbi:MAG: polysaccharide biosynthesis protein [Chitinophagaceae bacterium]
MNKLVERIYANPNFAKAFDWGRLITITGTAQIGVQAIGVISGILIIRVLPIEEYALYTLANTMLGTLVLLADGGISSGVMSQGGKVWTNPEKLGAVLATGLDLRKKFALFSLLITTPALLYLLRHHGVSWLMSMVIILSIIPAFIATGSGMLLEIAHKLQQDVITLQKIQIGSSVARISILSLSLFIFPWAFVALLAASFVQFWANKRLLKSSHNYFDQSQKPDTVVRKEILSLVKRILPVVLYQCVSGQMTIWLISIVGSIAAVAKIGALGRVDMMLTPLGVLFATLVSPRFARLPDNPMLLLNRYFQIQTVLVLWSAGIVGTVWLYSSEVLWVLGGNYSNLKIEVVLSLTGSCLNLIAASSVVLSTGRGYAINPLISIPVGIGSIVCGAFLIGLSSLEDVLKVNIFASGIQVVMHASYCILKIYRNKK